MTTRGNGPSLDPEVAVDNACEFGDIPCSKDATREPWCHPCMLHLLDQQNDLNERLNAEVERLSTEFERVRDDLGHQKHMRAALSAEMDRWVQKAMRLEAERDRLLAAIARHRIRKSDHAAVHQQPGKYGCLDCDLRLWSVLNTDEEPS